MGDIAGKKHAVHFYNIVFDNISIDDGDDYSNDVERKKMLILLLVVVTILVYEKVLLSCCTPGSIRYCKQEEMFSRLVHKNAFVKFKYAALDLLLIVRNFVQFFHDSSLS